MSTSRAPDSPLLESSLEIAQSDSVVILDHKAADVTHFRTKENRLIGRAIDGGTDSTSGDEHGDFNLAKGGLGQGFRLGADSDGECVGAEAEKVVPDEELGSTDLSRRY
jgi:hypothetical protein